MNRNSVQRIFIVFITVTVIFISACKKAYTYDSAAENTAVFSLGTNIDTACSGAIVAGTYKAGTAVTTANTMLISVNVAEPGTYTINTTTEDNISFSKAGVFSLKGLQTINLSASGTPAAIGTFNYRITNKDSSCIFSVPVN
jgi:hypothetical protein